MVNINFKVNGKNENPIYTFLKNRCPSVRKEFQAPYKLYYDPYHQDDIRYDHVLDQIIILTFFYYSDGILKSSFWITMVSQ